MLILAKYYQSYTYIYIYIYVYMYIYIYIYIFICNNQSKHLYKIAEKDGLTIEVRKDESSII